ncbi:MAG: C2 family cysteine protease, partial [Myxococcota bacterium]
EEAWSFIREYEKKGAIITTRSSWLTSEQALEERHVASPHAYAVLGTETRTDEKTGEARNYVRIRNPWGYYDMTDKDRPWKPIDAKDDGEFLISIEDFVKYFGEVHLGEFPDASN